MIKIFSQINKIIWGLLLLNFSLFSDYNLAESIDKLSKSKQWHQLLHVKNGKSEIDDSHFFFAPTGKIDPKAELKASITKLISDKSDDENSTLCYYPSRSQWILENFPQLKKDIFIPQCKNLKEELKKLNPQEVTLVLASAHINSPASAFGHTFLRIDADSQTPLLSYAINYAAQTNESNGFIYAYKGLFGGYEGRYSIAPYYKKIQEYSNLEQRDVWEYRLKLTPKEIHRLVLHIFEIRHFYADYFFLTENCSYNLLWLLEVAKRDIELTKKFNIKAIPIDTLRAIINKNLVSKTIYRPSKRKKILKMSEAIHHNPIALKFAKSDDYNSTLIKELNKNEKIASLDLASSLLQIKYNKHKIEKKEYLPKFLKLLKQRSKLGKIKNREIQEPPFPRSGHLSSKASISYTNKQEMKARIKGSYHDIYDNDWGYIPGAYINFLDTSLSYKDNRASIEEINLIDIRSYALQDAIFKPISWQVAVGAKRIFNNELNSYLQAGGGLTLGNRELYGYATITPTIYYRRQEEHSISANVGLLYNPSSTLKLGLLGSHEWFDQQRTIKRLEPFLTYSINQESAINIRHEYRNINGLIEKATMLSWFWYF